MSEPFFDYIHGDHKSVSKQLYGFEGREKLYERLKYLALPRLEYEQGTTLIEALRARKKARGELNNETLSLESLARLLGPAIARDDRNQGDKHYSFPSGGGLYPIETYLYAERVEGLKAGLYHYSSVEHGVTLIGEDKRLSLTELNDLYGSDIEMMPAALIIMTSVKSRYISKYGNLGYKLCLIEAGHRGQNLCLTASATGLGVCQLGGGTPDGVNTLLGVDGVNEHHIYALAVWAGTGS